MTNNRRLTMAKRLNPPETPNKTKSPNKADLKALRIEESSDVKAGVSTKESLRNGGDGSLLQDNNVATTPMAHQRNQASKLLQKVDRAHQDKIERARQNQATVASQSTSKEQNNNSLVDNTNHQLDAIVKAASATPATQNTNMTATIAGMLQMNQQRDDKGEVEEVNSQGAVIPSVQQVEQTIGNKNEQNAATDDHKPHAEKAEPKQATPAQEALATEMETNPTLHTMYDAMRYETLMLKAHRQQTESSSELETIVEPPPGLQPLSKFHKGPEEQFNENRLPTQRPSRRTKLANLARYDWKLKVRQDTATEAFNRMRDAAVNHMTELKKNADASVALFPFHKANKNLPAITDPLMIPKTLAEFRKYFDDAWVLVKGGYKYVKVLMGHNQTFSTIQENMGHIWRATETGCWARPLQVEKTTSMGWLLYSTGSMEKERITSVISGQTGIRVGLRWKTISLGTTGRVPKDKIVKAYHVEVDADNYRVAYPILKQFFSECATATSPLGSTVRLIPEIAALASPKSKAKAELQRNRQKNFLSRMKWGRSYDLVGIQHHHSDLGCSMLDILLSIPAKDGKKLFHSANAQWGEAGTTQLHFRPEVDSEARAMLAGLPVFLLHMAETYQFPKSAISGYFTKSSLDHHKNDRWDTIERCAITEADRLIEDCGEEDEGFEFCNDDWSQASNPMEDNLLSSFEAESVSTSGLRSRSDETLSTFQSAQPGPTNSTNRQKSNNRRKNPQARTATSDDLTEASSLSLESLHSDMAELRSMFKVVLQRTGLSSQAEPTNSVASASHE